MSDIYPVMDESGKVAEWLAAGRGVRVWESHDLGARRGDMLTPGDVETQPHWAYPKHGSKVLAADQVVFFRRVAVVKSWTDSPSGWKAAERYLGGMSIEEKHAERDAPIGKVYTRYTIERIQLESTQRVHMPGTPAQGPIPGMTAYDRPLMTEGRAAVVSWVAIVKKEESK